jgi:hypothetical protein
VSTRIDGISWDDDCATVLGRFRARHAEWDHSPCTPAELAELVEWLQAWAFNLLRLAADLAEYAGPGSPSVCMALNGEDPLDLGPPGGAGSAEGSDAPADLDPTGLPSSTELPPRHTRTPGRRHRPAPSSAELLATRSFLTRALCSQPRVGPLHKRLRRLHTRPHHARGTAPCWNESCGALVRSEWAVCATCTALSPFAAFCPRDGCDGLPFTHGRCRGTGCSHPHAESALILRSGDASLIADATVLALMRAPLPPCVIDGTIFPQAPGPAPPPPRVPLPAPPSPARTAPPDAVTLLEARALIVDGTKPILCLAAFDDAGGVSVFSRRPDVGSFLAFPEADCIPIHRESNGDATLRLVRCPDDAVGPLWAPLTAESTSSTTTWDVIIDTGAQASCVGPEFADRLTPATAPRPGAAILDLCGERKPVLAAGTLRIRISRNSMASSPLETVTAALRLADLRAPPLRPTVRLASLEPRAANATVLAHASALMATRLSALRQAVGSQPPASAAASSSDATLRFARCPGVDPTVRTARLSTPDLSAGVFSGPPTAPPPAAAVKGPSPTGHAKPQRRRRHRPRRGSRRGGTNPTASSPLETADVAPREPPPTSSRPFPVPVQPSPPPSRGPQGTDVWAEPGDTFQVRPRHVRPPGPSPVSTRLPRTTPPPRHPHNCDAPATSTSHHQAANAASAPQRGHQQSLGRGSVNQLQGQQRSPPAHPRSPVKHRQAGSAVPTAKPDLQQPVHRVPPPGRRQDEPRPAAAQPTAARKADAQQGGHRPHIASPTGVIATTSFGGLHAMRSLSSTPTVCRNSLDVTEAASPVSHDGRARSSDEGDRSSSPEAGGRRQDRRRRRRESQTRRGVGLFTRWPCTLA